MTLYAPQYQRGCGDLQEGGVYLVCAMSPFGTLPTAVLVEPPVPVDFGFFRGWRTIWTQAIELRLPTIAWWADTSAEAEQSRAMLQFDLTHLGLPWHLRRKGGLCGAAHSRAEAIAQYRYRLDELCVYTGCDPERVDAAIDWPHVPGREEIRPLLRSRQWAKTLTAIWRNWYIAPFSTTVNVTLYSLVVGLAGPEEADFLSELAVLKFQSTDLFQPPAETTAPAGPAVLDEPAEDWEV